MSDSKYNQEEKKGIIGSFFDKIDNIILPDSQSSNSRYRQGINMPASSIDLQRLQPLQIEPTIVYVDEKLTIFFVENTNEVAKEKTKLVQIAKSLVATGKVCIINYGSTVKVSELVDAVLFDGNLLEPNDIGEKSCLYEALIALENVIRKNTLKSRDIETTKWRIKKSRIKTIEIIGIGRCFDNVSAEMTTEAIESFNKVTSDNRVITKYFCLSEQDFIRTAELGFHSIGAINRSFK